MPVRAGSSCLCAAKHRLDAALEGAQAGLHARVSGVARVLRCSRRLANSIIESGVSRGSLRVPGRAARGVRFERAFGMHGCKDAG